MEVEGLEPTEYTCSLPARERTFLCRCAGNMRSHFCFNDGERSTNICTEQLYKLHMTLYVKVNVR